MVTCSIAPDSADATIGHLAYVDFVHKIHGASWFSKCGGPYPDDPSLKPIRWEEASRRILDMHLDAAACQELDVLLVSAGRAARRKPYGACLARVLAVLSGRSSMRHASLPKAECFKQLNIAAGCMCPKSRDPSVIAGHVSRLLEVVGDLTACDCLMEFPDLAKMAALALDGYLPVDVERAALHSRYVVY